MNLRAYAKINLTLDIIGKRTDNYHNIESLMQQIDLYDNINLELIKGNRIIIKCNDKKLENENNLAYKSAFLIKETFNIEFGIKIRISKNIPISSGLGGGSSDAAQVLKGLNQLLKLNLSNRDLIKLGEEIGSDVPFQIVGGCCLVSGKGEIVERIYNIPQFFVIIINPGFEIKTSEAYSDINLNEVGKKNATRKIIKQFNPELLHNDFEDSILRKYPDIKKIKDMLIKNKALNALLCGSGASVFGIFDDETKAKKAYKNTKELFPFVYLGKTIK